MNGATALDCANTISRPNSDEDDDDRHQPELLFLPQELEELDMTRLFSLTSEHALEMLPVAIPRRIRRPPFELSGARERILADHPPHQRHAARSSENSSVSRIRAFTYPSARENRHHAALGHLRSRWLTRPKTSSTAPIAADDFSPADAVRATTSSAAMNEEDATN